MKSKFVEIGFKSLVNSNRILVVINPDSAPIKRVILDAKQNNLLIDATYGRKIRSVIIMDSGHVVLSLLGAETIKTRLENNEE